MFSTVSMRSGRIQAAIFALEQPLEAAMAKALNHPFLE